MMSTPDVKAPGSAMAVAPRAQIEAQQIQYIAAAPDPRADDDLIAAAHELSYRIRWRHGRRRLYGSVMPPGVNRWLPVGTAKTVRTLLHRHLALMNMQGGRAVVDDWIACRLRALNRLIEANAARAAPAPAVARRRR